MTILKGAGEAVDRERNGKEVQEGGGTSVIMADSY